MTHKCLVCSYDDLYEDPYDERGVASDEICPCCGFHYGFDDDGTNKGVYEKWRTRWIAEGCKWFSNGRHQPEWWDAKVQFKVPKHGDYE